NANHHSPDEIWNSPVAQEIRGSILDGSFKYCLDLCPAIQKNTLPARVDDDETRGVRLDEGPTFLSLLEDRTCNLSCPSCRTSLIIADTEEQERLRVLLDRVIEPLLPGVHTLELAGGEFLASRHLREVLALIDAGKHPHLRIVAWTNGTLFNEKTWAQLKNLHRRFERIHVSLDAARPETFERIRRGGDWSVVRQNLDFIARLRRMDECEEFTLRFVVQRDNFHEMGELVDLGRELGCDRVIFHELLNFDTFTAAEYAELDVLDPGHELRGEFARALADPRLDDPIADLGNLTAIRAELFAGPVALAR
ncbi:MAG TPA: radical SAM protein, partial [Thermoanaerobaculia bacterium]|nr:radical SAM protein [Thermoanaerobaculia bacterium]